MVDGRNRINLWLLVNVSFLSGRVQAWRDRTLGICSRQDSTLHTACRPVRHLIKHRLQLSGFVLQGEREGICLPRASLPSHDCSHVVCFNAAISLQFCDIFNLGILTHDNSSEGHKDSCCPLVVTTPSRIHLGDQGQRWKIHNYQLLRPCPKPKAAHSQVYGAPGPEDNTGKGQHQQEGIQPKVGRQPLHTRVSPKDMSPGRSFFVDTFGIRAGLGYK